MSEVLNQSSGEEAKGSEQIKDASSENHELTFASVQSKTESSAAVPSEGTEDDTSPKQEMQSEFDSSAIAGSTNTTVNAPDQDNTDNSADTHEQADEANRADTPIQNKETDSAGTQIQNEETDSAGTHEQDGEASSADTPEQNEDAAEQSEKNDAEDIKARSASPASSSGESVFEDDLRTLISEFPELNSALRGGISTKRYGELRALGLSVREAYLAASTPRGQDNRAHIISGVPSGARSPDTGMSARQMEIARSIFHNLPEQEIKRLYSAVTNSGKNTFY